MYPSTPPSIEAANIPSFACMRWVSSTNARVDMNIDMVKPMDARKPTPTSLRVVIEADMRASLRRVSRNTEATMPTGFPISRPSITPIATLFENTASMLIPSNDMPALASANIGMMTNHPVDYLHLLGFER